MPNSKLPTNFYGKPEGIERGDGYDDYYLAPDPQILTGLQFQILNVNIAGLHLIGQRFTLLERMPLLHFISMADRHNVFAACMELLDAAEGESVSAEITICPPRRRAVRCSVTVTLQRGSRGNPHGFLWRVQDSTARMREQESLQHLQQMQALSRLAHSVSHEFSNLLTGIRIHADVARRTQCPNGRQESLDEIRINCERAVGLLSQLRAFKNETDPGENVRGVE